MFNLIKSEFSELLIIQILAGMRWVAGKEPEISL